MALTSIHLIIIVSIIVHMNSVIGSSHILLDHECIHDFLGEALTTTIISNKIK